MPSCSSLAIAADWPKPAIGKRPIRPCSCLIAAEPGSVAMLITNAEPDGKYESSDPTGLPDPDDELEPQPASTTAATTATRAPNRRILVGSVPPADTFSAGPSDAPARPATRCPV